MTLTSARVRVAVGTLLVASHAGCGSSASSPAEDSGSHALPVDDSGGRPANDANVDTGVRPGSAFDATPASADGGDTRADGEAAPADASDAGKPVAHDAGAFSISGFIAGTNLSGAEFGTVPGVYGSNYTYPTTAEVDYFTGKGFRVLRIPFLWERMQPTLGQTFDAAELGRLSSIVTYATSKGDYVLIDPHDYARYHGAVIGDVDAGSDVSAAQFAAFWAELAGDFSSNPHVIFGLMNEPNSMPTELWLADANAAIAAIRGAHARNVIFVPGNGWTGAASWAESDYGTPNATVMLGVHDPIDNYVFEVHQYLDSNSSGTSATCVSATIGSERLTAFTGWLEAHHLRGFLGEFGVANNPTCTSALSDMLSYIDQNKNVWVGWTWWSAGPWWGTYMFSIEPANGQDAPQTATLVQHL